MPVVNCDNPDMDALGEGKRQISHHGSHNWDGDTLVEQSKWTFRGHEIYLSKAVYAVR